MSAALLLELLTRPGWHSQAACRGLDPSWFFPDQGEPTTTAKQVCARCPVRAQCAAYGLHEPTGIWGGMSARERKRARRAAA